MKNRVLRGLYRLGARPALSIGATDTRSFGSSKNMNTSRGRYNLVLMVLAMCLLSCESVKPLVANPKEGFRSLWWDMKMKRREAGEKLLENPDEVWKELRCDQRDLPYIQIENSEVIPVRLKAGQKINHHMVYSMCPPGPTEVVPTRLIRHIYYKGTVIFQDANADFELKPGRWSVDAFVTVSDKAEQGIYSLEIELTTNKEKITQNTNFVVVKKAKGTEKEKEKENEKGMEDNP